MHYAVVPFPTSCYYLPFEANMHIVYHPGKMSLFSVSDEYGAI